MDADLAKTLAKIEQGFETLAGAVGMLAGIQRIQGEKIDRVLELLTPDEAPEGESLKDLMERQLSATEAFAGATAEALLEIKRGIRNLPLDTTQAIHDNLGPLAKEP